MAQDLKVVLRIDGETGKVRFEVDKLEKGLKDAGVSGKKAGDNVSKGMDKATKSTKNTNKLVNEFRQDLLRLASVGFAVVLAKGFVKVADTMKLLDARIKLVTDSQREFNHAQAETIRIALETHTSLEDTVNLYTRLERSLKTQGSTQEDVLRITQTINEAFAVSGATAIEASNAIRQLTQSFSANRLSGDEFRSVSEQGSRIMQVLQVELGKTAGELKKMAEAGDLTTKVLTDALLGQADVISKEFAELPVTVDKALVDLGTKFAIYAKGVNESSNITGKLSDTIVFLSENLEEIIETLSRALIAFAVLKGARGILGVTFALKSVIAAGGVYDTVTKRMIVSTSLMTATTRKLSAVLRANPLLIIATAGFAAFELIDNILDEHNEKLEELSEQSKSTADAIGLINEEFNKGFDADFSNVSKSIEKLNSELINLKINAIQAKAELIQDLESGGAVGAGFDIAKNLVSGGGFNTTSQLANDAKQKEIETTLALAKANEFLTDTFAPLIAEAQRLTNAENAVAQAIEDTREVIEKWIEASNKEIEKITAKNEAFGKSTIEIIKANAEAKKKLTTDKTLRAEIDKTTAALIKQVQINERNVKSKKDDIASEKLRKQIIEESTKKRNQLIKDSIELLENYGTEAEKLLLIEIKRADELKKFPELQDTVNKKYDEQIEKVSDLADELSDIELSDMFDGFAQGLNPAIGALQSFKDEISTINELTESGKFSAGQQAFYSTGLAAEFALNSMASMAEEGSKAQKVLQTAAAITNTILGISAILEQGKGDPYTAFARMAAMATMVASMGVQIAGAFGGSGGGGAARQQENQGTGTVLGDVTAKSESISNALEIIADASNKIVGINSKMLRSLNTMSNAITGTVNQIAQTGDIGNLGTVAGGFTGFSLGDGITDAIMGFLFGSSEVTDRGINVLSGSIADAINGDIFQAYEDATRSGLFGSSSSTNTAALEDGISNQIGLIFEAMSDAVLAGAEALGVNLTDVQSALDSFRIEEQRISLLDLTADEQRAELEAVFSSIFDGLVSVSIPFITQFQQAGEGLGETLARVATTVLVFEEAIESMGLDFIAKELNPELFAQAAIAIADFAGGMDSFIDGYSSYISNFLTEAEQMDILSERLTGVFSDIDIKLPSSREGFTELIQGLDLTTVAGQEAFGILISLSSQLDSHYSGLEQAIEQAIKIENERLQAIKNYVDFTQSVQDEINRFESSNFVNSISDIRQAEAERISTLNDLAIAAGRVGASEKDLYRIHQLTALQVEQAIGVLRDAIASLQDQLYGDDLENRIAELEALQLGGISTVENSLNGLYDSWIRVIDQLRDYTRDRLVGDLSPLEADERLALAQQNFFDAVEAAQGGDLAAAQSLIGLANIVDQLNAAVNASGTDYNDIFFGIQDALDSVELPEGLTDNIITGNFTVQPSAELQALYDELEARNAAGEAENRLALATQLAEHLNELALAINEPLFQIADEIGLNMTSLVADLGVNLDDLTAASVRNLANIANLLGVELSELADNLGDGVSNALGELADAQSLLNDALENTIGDLPQEWTDLLEPLLQDVEDAADGKPQEQALLALIGATSNLPVEYRNLLAPFFDDIDVTSEMQEQSAYMLQQISWLQAINSSISGGLPIANDDTFNTSIENQTVELVSQTLLLGEIRDSVRGGVDTIELPIDFINFVQSSNSTSDTEVLESKIEELTKINLLLLAQAKKGNNISTTMSDNLESINDSNNTISKKEVSDSSFGRVATNKSVFG